MLSEWITEYGRITMGADYPVFVNDRCVTVPSPIPRFDNPKMMGSEALILSGAGREKKIYAIPPCTKVVSLDFNSHPSGTEDFQGECCRLCGASHVYLDEVIGETNGRIGYRCNDTSQCLERLNARGRGA